MSEQCIFVFNQYYWDLLKKSKDLAKQKKEVSKPARNILRAIRSNYTSFDKSSIEHLEFFKTEAASFWNDYTTKPIEEIEAEATLSSSAVQIFKGVSLGDLFAVLQHPYLLHQYLVIFGLLTEISDPAPLVEVVKAFTSDEKYAVAFDALDSDRTKEIVGRLHVLYKKNVHISMDEGLRDIENTSLGKLAKEIMSEVNIEELQKTLGSGNIADIFQNPAGLTNLLSTVSQKMVSKMASGEIKQEQLFQDAMSLAAKLPSMLPGGMAKDLGNLGDILGSMTGGGASTSGGGGGGGDGFDFSSMAAMMSNMMGQPKAKTNAAGARMNAEMKRQALAKKLQKKLASQKKAEDDVE